MTAGRIITDPDELATAMLVFEVARKLALLSPCKRGRCGAVVHAGALTPAQHPLLGRGFNSPPGKSVPRCERKHELGPGFKSDRTCCVHAEVRAAREASYAFASRDMALDGVVTRIYFARVDDAGAIQPSGQPYCTICSKEALDVGIDEWALIHGDGVRVYTALEYNDLSYAYGQAG